MAISFYSRFLMYGGLVKAGTIPKKFDKSVFYTVMATGDIDAVEEQLDVLKEASITEKDGYEGALLMKKAGLVKKNKDKLSFFKAGRIKLETALAANDANTEFHFLRLAVQEHAPKIVKYRSDIEKDKTVIQKNFKNLELAVQHAILDYCKNSKVLHKEDF